MRNSYNKTLYIFDLRHLKFLALMFHPMKIDIFGDVFYEITAVIFDAEILHRIKDEK